MTSNYSFKQSFSFTHQPKLVYDLGMSSTKFDISIFITNWNGYSHGYIQEAFPSIRKAVSNYSKGRCEIIVVDDVSSDESAEWIKKNYPEFKLLIPEKNLGYQEASNFAVKNCKYDILISLNNDIKLEKNVLNKIVEHFNDPLVFAVSTKVYLWDEKTYLAGHRYAEIKHGLFLLHDSGDIISNIRMTLFATGGAAAFRKEMYLKLGGFQRIFHPLYWEDIDLCYRALKRDWKVLYDPNCIMYHKHQATIKKMYDPKNLGLITARNSYIFFWKNITDKKFLFEHLIYTFIFHIRDLFKMRFRFITATFMALSRIRQILKLRLEEKREGFQLSDREVLDILKKEKI